jgi:hypothetical protein
VGFEHVPEPTTLQRGLETWFAERSGRVGPLYVFGGFWWLQLSGLTDTTGYTHHVWPHIPLVTPWIAPTFQTSSNCSALCRRGFHVGYGGMLGVMHSAAWLGVYGVDVGVG